MEKVIAALAILFYFTPVTSAQEANNFDLDIKISTQYQNMLGNNVYNTAHDNWKGYLMYVGVRYNNSWTLGMQLQSFNAGITDKSKIYFDETCLRSFTLELSHQFYVHKRFSIAPFVNFGSIKGKNQGPFVGTQLGGGFSVFYYIRPKIYFCASSEFDRLWLDIKAAKSIEHLYNNTYALQAKFGIGKIF